MKPMMFLGTRRGLLVLEAVLAAGIRPVGIVCMKQDEHETDRCDDAILALAENNRIPVWVTRTFRQFDHAAFLQTCQADVAVLVGVRVLLPPDMTGAFPLGAYAAHDSLLPSYRGFAPLNWSILNGETETGVTLFRIGVLTDDGPIFAQHRVSIGPLETAPEVYGRICDATIAGVLDLLQTDGHIASALTTQDELAASYTCSRTPRDGLIDWDWPTAKIHNLVRALAPPYPGAFTFMGGTRMTIVSASPGRSDIRYVGRIPGRPVSIDSQSGTVDVLTGDGLLRLKTVALEDGHERPAAEIIRSVRARLGLDALDLYERLRLLEQQLAFKDSQ